MFATGCEFPRYFILSILDEGNTSKHLPKGCKLLDMSQGEALLGVNLTDQKIVVRGLADQAHLLF